MEHSPHIEDHRTMANSAEMVKYMIKLPKLSLNTRAVIASTSIATTQVIGIT